MKQKGQKTENRIGVFVVLGCMMLMVGVCIFAGSYLRRGDAKVQKIAQTSDSTQQTEELTMETQAVKAKENMLGSSFQNSSEDKRKPIRIVEVIPHKACSLFPYWVDWGTKEGYDENTFLGYEGLRHFTRQANSDGSKYQYTLQKDGFTREALDNYDVSFISEDGWQGSVNWWRTLKLDENIPESGGIVNGYFEYVGNNKGLYEINLKELAEEGSSDLGIRYRIMAMARKGTENKKGEWEVKDAQYYWAKDYPGTTYPDGLGGPINQITGYNYDLKFQVGASGTSAADYKVKMVSVLTESVAGLAGAEDYEYAAILADGTVDWQGGYVYSGNGNYEVSAAAAVKVDDSNLSDVVGKYYIRINNADKADGSTGSDAGYFRLCTTEDHITAGSTVYDVTFRKQTLGSYILTPAAVQSAINQDGDAALNKILFEYAGEGLGNYNLSFIYNPGNTGAGGAAYSATLLTVSDGDGRYALTSTVTDENDLYEKLGAGQGDYSKVVTNIDCAGIDYTSVRVVVSQWHAYTVNTEGYFDTQDELPGLTVGMDKHGGEHGNWVFHTVDSDEVNGYTKIEELENGQVPSNKRIYVYGQNRKNRYYAQNTFDNSEWFKLLLYLSTPDGSQPLAYQDYVSGSMTPEEIKQKYAQEIAAFDRSYRIEIIQKTPSELTVDDVEKADLLYFGSRIGLQGMSINTWNSLIASANLDLETCSQDQLKYTDDLSTEVLFAIYENCLYDCTTSLLMSAEDVGNVYCQDASNVTTNLGKMYFLVNLFKDPTDFEYFLDGYEQQNEQYTAIHTDGSLSAYKQHIQGLGDFYNAGRFRIESDFNGAYNAGDPITPLDTDTWNKAYFRVVEFDIDENGKYTLMSKYDNGDGMYGDNWGTHSWANFRGEDVTDDFRTWYIPGLTSDAFWGYSKTNNIWKILHNKKSKVTSDPVVVVTNADGDNISELTNVTPVYYFYVDAFALGGGNEDFIIDYQVNWTPEEVDEPTPLSDVTVTRSGGSVVQAIAGPNYDTDYSCNVAGDFIKDGAFDASINSREYTITARDTSGKEDSVIVRFIVRDAFMLN